MRIAKQGSKSKKEWKPHAKQVYVYRSTTTNYLFDRGLDVATPTDIS